jgi:hypothetical protein
MQSIYKVVNNNEAAPEGAASLCMTKALMLCTEVLAVYCENHKTQPSVLINKVRDLFESR